MNHVYNASHALEIGKEFKQRIDALEASTKRIEDAIGQLCERLGKSQESTYIELEMRRTGRIDTTAETLDS